MAEDHPVFKLGKNEHKHDDRTLMMADFIDLPVVPAHWDFDKHRRPFPVHMWGNDNFGDCVIAAQANHLLRLERVEQRRTIILSDKDAVARYKHLSGCVNAGDSHDTGLVMLDSFSNWRNEGFYRAEKPRRFFKIAAYGELDPADKHQLHAAIYLLGGVHFGFALPISAQAQTNKGYWDVSPIDGAPGSWGGHAVFSKKYDDDSIYVESWGRTIRVTNRFVKKYCDEVWTVVDDVDRWRKASQLDVKALIAKLHSIGAKNIN